MADFDSRAARDAAHALAKALDDSALRAVPALVESLSALVNREAELKASNDAMAAKVAAAKQTEAAAIADAVQVKKDADNEARRILATCEDACRKARLKSQHELAVLEEQKRATVDAVKADVAAEKAHLDAVKREVRAIAESKATLDAEVSDVKAKLSGFLQ